MVAAGAETEAIAAAKLEGNKFIARVDSGHETATSEEEEDSSTPHHSPLPLTSTSSTSSTPTINNNSAQNYSTASQLPPKFDNSYNRSSASETSSCSQCRLTTRRFPITSEKDLYRLSTTCTHNNTRRTPLLFAPLENMNRSSSAVIYSERNRHQHHNFHVHQSDQDYSTAELMRKPPPKLTGTLNSVSIHTFFIFYMH